MKAFARKVTKLFKKNIKQDTFFCSLLANASALKVFQDVLQHFFIILLLIFQKSLATLLSNTENMANFKTLRQFGNEEEVRGSLEDENKEERDGNQTKAYLTKGDLHKAQNYSETDEKVNKGKQERKGKVSQDIDNEFEEISNAKKALVKR